MKNLKIYFVILQLATSKLYTFVNTIRKGVVVVEENVFSNLVSNHSEKIDSSTLQSLYDEGFVVMDDDDENSRINMFFTSAKFEYFSYATMILTSYDCNMRCPYCFENGIKAKKDYMTEKTAKDVAEWLKIELKKYQPKYTGIAFSGGEPLINKKAISIIINEMKDFCDDIGIVFSFGFLTNGTLEINEADAEEYNRCNIKFIQYTLDGNKEINDKRRLIEGGSYNTILSNIVKNNKLMNIDTIVRVNIDNENYSDIDDMLMDLRKLCIDDLVLDFAVRFETPCDVKAINSNVLQQKDVPDRIIQCMKKAKKLGLNHSRRFTNDSPCLSIVPRQFVIDPQGDLYKCAAFAGEKDFVVGNIYNDDLNEKYVDVVGHDAWHECKQCPYVPLCGGGCLFINRNTHGNFKKKVCQRQLFEGLVMETLISTLDEEAIVNQLKESVSNEG